MAIAKPLALMAVLLSVSPSAFAMRPCNEAETSTASDSCHSLGGGWSLGGCSATNDGSILSVECCPYGGGDCVYGDIYPYIVPDSDGELPEDDDRGDPVDPPPSPDDADELLDDEFGFEDEDTDPTRGTEEPDAGPEIGACCLDGVCVDDLTIRQCEGDYGTWSGSEDCTEVEAECASVGDDDTGIEPGGTGDGGIDDGEFGLADDDTGAIGYTIGDNDGTISFDAGGDEDDPDADDGDTGIDDAADPREDTPATEPYVPLEPLPAGTCSTSGRSRGGLHFLIPLMFVGLVSGFRRR
jgi:hypothetical protein